MSSVRGCGSSTRKLSAMRAGPAVSTITRVPRNTASVMPWVTNTMVFFASCQMRSSSRFIFSRVSASSAPNGSSIRISLGSWIERTRDRGALLHAAGELVGIFVLVALEPDQREQIAGASAARRHRQAEDFGRQQHVVDDAPPFQQQRLLEHHADVARRIERLRRRADASPRRSRRSAARRESSAASSCRSPTGRPAKRVRRPRRRTSPPRWREIGSPRVR